MKNWTEDYHKFRVKFDYMIELLTCNHDYTHSRNIYGDEINGLNGKRSEWKCVKCGMHQFRDKLFETE